MWKNLELWARKALDRYKHSLMAHSGVSLENKHVERDADNGGMAHEISEGNKGSLGLENICSVFWQRI